jgi:hypothetical protein
VNPGTVFSVIKPCILPPASTAFFLSLLLDPEDGGDMFSETLGSLRTAGRYNP